MNRITTLLLAASMVLTYGCAKNPELIKASSISTRSDVFQELPNGGSVPEGNANLRISSSLKTHIPGIYSSKDIHGTPEYDMLLNIDGQTARIKGDLKVEKSEPGGIRDSEAGDGIRYHFKKNVRLKPGTHKIVIAVPEDEIAVELEITLSQESNNLVLEPLYRMTPGKQRPGFYGATSFTEGLKGFRVVLNGDTL